MVLKDEHRIDRRYSIMTGAKIWVATFGTDEYATSKILLRHTALHDGHVDAVVACGPENVSPFFDRHPLLQKSARGYGWWSWKPQIILAVLDMAADGDVVIWCDAAMTFVSSVDPYVKALRETSSSGILLFRLGEWETKDHRIRTWCRWRVIEDLGVDQSIIDMPMVNGAIQMYRKTPDTMDFVRKYAGLCANANLIADAPMDEPQDAAYKDHRHDQAILSVLAHTTPGVDIARDPTQYGIDDPVLACADLPQLVEHHRQILPKIPKIAVITAAVGGPHLRECIASVQNQVLPNIEHWVVADGPDRFDAVKNATNDFQFAKPIQLFCLPSPTGLGGWNGHRIYAALPWLVDAEYVAFLDEDNVFDPDHLAHLVSAITAGGGKARWAYSLRTIVDQVGNVVCADNCESLGGLCHTILSTTDRLIDTSCYLLGTDVARMHSAAWNSRSRDPSGMPEVDRELARRLLTDTTLGHACVPRHSVRYRTGSTDRSVSSQFFHEGNRAFGYDFATKESLYIFMLTPSATKSFLATRKRRDRSYALDEWQQTLCRGLDDTHNLLDGYANIDNIPLGAPILVVLWHPSAIPTDFLAKRTDLLRVCYTLESPNIRHASQWTREFLSAHFDVLLTYWKPLLSRPPPGTTAIFCPHNTHHLDIDDNPMDAAHIRKNRGSASSRTVVYVAECRDLSGTYDIDDETLTCLDPLRRKYVSGLKNVVLRGTGWTPEVVSDMPGNVFVTSSVHRSHDDMTSVDVMQDYSFAMAIENTDAEGYASEKLYDILMAGAIPVYYGSIPAEVNIPKEAYIDLKLFEDGTALQEYLELMTDDEVVQMKARIVEIRDDILRTVGVTSFAKTVRTGIEIGRTMK
jgi:glycosyltransferase involved in cell wall biosynthesis